MGPDGDRRWQGPTASLLYRPLHAEPGSCDRKLLSTVDGFVLCLDGRIDNWTDLKEQNYGHDVESVVLNVYRSKGTAGLSLLVGDFALAIWDPTQQVLLVACDPLGRRPLYTLQRGEYFSWASQARPLLDAWGMMREVDSEYIADYLINNPSSHSPYLAVEQVHGGDAVVVTPGRIAREKYWSLQPNQTIEYPDDAQYEEHFREIFVEAVRCRLPENTPVFCELSGGVDSSSIVCAADDVCQQREGSRARIRTVSFVFNRSRSADEREYIALVEEQRRLRGLHVSEDDCPLLGVLPSSVQPDWPTNTLIFFQRYHRTAAEMKASGARVLLNGIGGDQLFWSEPPVVLCLADLLIERKVRRYLSELCDCARRSGWPLLKAFLHSVVPLLSTTRIIGEDDDIELGD